MVNIGVVGATGQVGQVMRALLDERDFPATSVRFFASARSQGKKLDSAGSRSRSRTPRPPTPAVWTSRLFSAGATMSRVQAPRFAAAGADRHRQLVGIPQGPRCAARRQRGQLRPGCRNRARSLKSGIIANPNCTTMAAMPVLKPLHDEAQLVRMIASTYQAVSAVGWPASRTFRAGPRRRRRQREAGARRWRAGVPAVGQVRRADRVQRCAACGFARRRRLGETDEDQKLRNESRKILGIPSYW
jgi:aspartate-semialdehyde dehydrogenase